MKKEYSLNALKDYLEQKLKVDILLVGNPLVMIYGVASLQSAATGQIAFIKSANNINSDLKADAFLIKKELANHHVLTNYLIVPDPYVAFAYLSQFFDKTPHIAIDIAPTAIVDPSATLGEGVKLGHNVIIAADVIIGDNVHIGANSYIGHGSQIGNSCIIHPNVTIYHDVFLGRECRISSGVVIGADGFGYANDKGSWIRIVQSGGVRIGNNVELGANTCIDRGALEHTEIHDGVIIDNLVQIGHNDIIGAYSAIASATIIAGSVRVGKHCIMGGGCCIAGHLTIADGVMLSGGTNITNNIEKGNYASATVATDVKLWRRNTIRFRRLDELFDRVKKIEQQLEQE